MHTYLKGEIINLVFDIEESDVALTGTEPVTCHLKKAGAGGLPKDGPPSLVLDAAYHAASGQNPAYFSFAGSSATLDPGTYVFDAFITIAGQPVGLDGGVVRILKAATVLP